MSSLLGDKLQACLQEKNCYEAHQIYRTMYFRLARAGKNVEAYDRMYEGAMNMFNLQEPLSGVDLANLLVELLNKEPAGKALWDAKKDTIITNLGTLFDHIIPGSQEREAFVINALNVQALSPAGKDALRTKFANVYWKESNYVLARKHFLHSSESGDKVAKFLIESQMSKGAPEEVDLMIAQFVLQALMVKRYDLARSTFFNYVEKHPMIGQNKPNFALPLLSFLYYLIEAKHEQNEAEASKTFMALCKMYESVISKDPEFHRYLETIGHNYFGLPKPSKSSDDNPLASIMKSLMGDGSGTSGPGLGALTGGLTGNPQLRQIFRPAGGQSSGASAPRPQPQASRQPADDDLD